MTGKLITFLMVSVYTLPLTLLHGWVVMLCLGALSHELSIEQLAISFLEAVLLRMVVSWLFYQYHFDADN